MPRQQSAAAAKWRWDAWKKAWSPWRWPKTRANYSNIASTSPSPSPNTQSALLPIIGQTLQGQKVSLYNQRVNAKHPLNGYRLKNTSSLHLMQGPITLFDSGTYAGDARIEDLPPGQDRLISYALDLKTEVEPKLEGGTQELATVSLKKGTMLISRRLVEDRTYLVKNRDAKAKTVLIEQPYRADWKLAEPKEPTERTRDLYRFNVAVDPGKSATLRVKETLPIQESILLMDSGIDQIVYYQQAKEVSPKVKEALQRVVQLRSKLDDARGQRMRLDQRTAEITAEHARIRENMQRLQQNSDLYNRYVKKLDQQETELEKLAQGDRKPQEHGRRTSAGIAELRDESGRGLMRLVRRKNLPDIFRTVRSRRGDHDPARQ